MLSLTLDLAHVIYFNVKQSIIINYNLSSIKTMIPILILYKRQLNPQE